MTGMISVPDVARNPGAFDFNRYLSGRKIYGVVFSGSDLHVERSGGFGLFRVMHISRNLALSVIEKYVGTGECAGLVQGLITGNRADLDRDTVEEFTRIGIVHLLAVSGLHVGLIAVCVRIVLSSIRIQRPAVLILTVITLFSYTAFTGFRISVIRSSVMLSLFLLAPLTGRAVTPMHSLYLVGTAVLLYQPHQLFDVGFQLSFSAAAGILLGMRSRGEKVSAVSRWLFEPFKVSLFAQLATLPVLLHHFGRISLISPFSNLLVLPVVGILLPASLLLLFLSPLHSFALAAGGAVKLLAWIVLSSSEFLAKVPFAEFYPGLVPGFAVGVYYIFLGSVLLPAAGMKARRIVAVSAILTVVGTIGVSTYRSHRYLTVSFLDVGQGDCITLTLPGGDIMVIDAGGRRWSGFDYGERVVIPYLRYIGARTIDILMCTHAHHDHYGGLSALLNHFTVDTFISGDTLAAGSDYRSMMAHARAKAHETIIPPGNVPTIFASNNCTTWIWNPSVLSKESYSINDRSLTVKIRYGKATFIFSGDLEIEGEELWLNHAGIHAGATVLKAPHHGSSTSSAEEYIDKIRPSIAVISCGRRNRFGHPDPEIISRYLRRGVRVYRTDVNGAVILRTDGNFLEMRRMVSGKVEKMILQGD